jgi:AraC-like DNA-binding protein/quercetin dioxygenase-like cupin family protein
MRERGEQQVSAIEELPEALYGRQCVVPYPPAATSEWLEGRETEQRDLAVSVSRLPYPAPTGHDMHLAFEIEVVLSGGFEQAVGDWAIGLEAGDVFLLPSWEPHGWRATEPDTTVLILHFLPQFLGENTIGRRLWLDLFAVPPELRPRVTNEVLREKVLTICGELRSEAEGGRPAWDTAVRLCMMRLLLLLGREWVAPPRATRDVYVSAAERIAPAIALAHKEWSRRISLLEAAAACGLNAQHFSELFAHTIGMGFAEFGLRIRLNHAAGFLAQTALPVEAVAEKSGFASASHFHKAFKDRFHCSPGEYRRKRGQPASLSIPI